MSSVRRPGAEAVETKGWFAANQWLLARRVSQLSILAVFLLGPWLGVWLVKGNLNASLTLDVLPLTDPYVLLQSLLAGHLMEITSPGRCTDCHCVLFCYWAGVCIAPGCVRSIWSPMLPNGCVNNSVSSVPPGCRKHPLLDSGCLCTTGVVDRHHSLGID